MEFNFGIWRITAWVVLIGGFWWWGGFENPAAMAPEYFDTRRVSRAWLWCVILFVSGATASTVVDHYVGNLDRSNLRFLYVLMGVASMVGAVVWLRGLMEGMGVGG